MNVIRSFAVLTLAVFSAAILVPAELRAQDREVPYWASLRFDEVYMRVGPSQEYPIEWVYKREGMPLKIVRLREGWRLVRDHEGVQGWIAESQLSLSRGALIIGEGPVEMRETPNATSPLRWRAEPGVVGELIRCRENFCEIDVAGRSGWVAKDRVWGAANIVTAPPTAAP